MATFEELMAEKERRAESDTFTRLMAEKQARETQGRTRFPKTGEVAPAAPVQPRREHPLSAELWDVGKAGMQGVARGAEFLTDLANFPLTLGERHRHGMQATAERDSFLPRVLGGGLENYLAGALGTPTERGEAISELYDTETLYAPSIPEDEGSTWRGPASRFLGLTGELGTTGFLGGGRAAPLVAKSIPTSAAFGTVGGELYGTGGEISGVIAGALAHDPRSLAQLTTLLTQRLQAAPRRIGRAARQLKRSVRSGATLDTASDKEIREGLRELLKNMTGPGGSAVSPEDIEMLLPRVEVALQRGQRGTVAQIVDDPGLREFETIMAKDDRAGDALLRSIDADINRAAKEAVTDIAPEGVAADAPNFPRALADQARREAEAITDAPRAARVQAEAAELEARAPFTQDDITQRGAGRRLSNAVDAIKEQEFDAVKQKWAALDDVEQTIPADRLQTRYARNLSKAVGGDQNLIRAFEDDFPRTTARIAQLEGDVSIAALSDVLSLLSKESVGTSTNPAVITSVKEALYRTISQGSRKRKAAANAHREYMEKWGPKTTTGRALSGEPEDFGTTVITPGPKGATRLDVLLENAGPEVGEQAQDVLRARFRDQVMDADGNINATKAATFQRQYKEHLAFDSMADLRTEVDNASVRASALRDRTKALDEAEKASKRAVADVEKSDIAILGDTGSTDVEIRAAMQRILKPGKGRDVTGELTGLVDQVKGNEQAFSNIRRAAADEFLNSVTKDGKLSQNAFNTFKQRRDAYEKSGLFTKAELDRINDQFVEGQKMYLGRGDRLPKLPPEKRRVAEAVAALAGAKVGAQLFGSPLIGAAMGRKFATDKFRELSDEKARALAFELTTNPDKFVKWVNILKRPDATPTEINDALVGILETATVASRTALSEDE